MPIDVQVALKELDGVLAEVVGLAHAPPGEDPDEDPEYEDAATCAKLISACLDRLAPPGSRYVADAVRVRSVNPNPTWFQYRSLVGILKALRADYAAGRLQAVRELLHAELFADFLEAAQHLLDEGYKDPAAAIAGSSLEAHLRKLADKHNVATTSPDGAPRKWSSIAVDLAKTTPAALSKGDSKSVTAWLNTRNDAAHGDYSKYDTGIVRLMIAGIRDFITRNPA